MTTAMIMMLDATFGWDDAACFVNYDDDVILQELFVTSVSDYNSIIAAAVPIY